MLPGSSYKLGILTGLSSEARLVAPFGQVAVGGGGRAGAVLAADRLVRSGASALLSFGVAGGLVPDLPAGTLVVPKAVWVAGRRIACDDGLIEWLGGATTELIADSPHTVNGVADKQALWRQSGAAAVDLESGPLALAAEQAGLRFAVLRAICDPAGRSLPSVVQTALNPNGGISVLSLLQGIIAEPRQITAIFGLAADAARARRSLQAAMARTSRGE